MPRPSWSERKKWNREVQGQIDALAAPVKWLQELEEWGNDNKDWYTARAAGRAKLHLQHAELEMYDLQYNPDEQWRSKWVEGLDIEE